MDTYPIYARLTHNYATGWAHLDRHEFLANLKLTPPKLVHVDENGDLTRHLHGRISAQQMRKLREAARRHPSPIKSFRHRLQVAIAENFSGGCRCEHDCCGHYQQWAKVRLFGRKVFVKVSSYQNL